LTDTQNTTPEIPYPTEWHMIDDIRKTECRQLSVDTYELRNAGYTIILPKKGFDLFRDGSPQGEIIFEQWCDDHNIFPTPRSN
jgi:hypothetical protein